MSERGALVVLSMYESAAKGTAVGRFSGVGAERGREGWFFNSCIVGDGGGQGWCGVRVLSFEGQVRVWAICTFPGK